jgi:hypothetical protein
MTAGGPKPNRKLEWRESAYRGGADLSRVGKRHRLVTHSSAAWWPYCRPEKSLGATGEGERSAPRPSVRVQKAGAERYTAAEPTWFRAPPVEGTRPAPAKRPGALRIVRHLNAGAAAGPESRAAG